MMKSKTSAVCFDMWGTLMIGGGVKLWEELRTIFKAQPIPIKDFIRLGEKSIMLTPHPLLQGVSRFAASLELNISQEKIQKAYKCWWSYVEKAHPYPDSETVLKKINELEITTFILSNTDISSFNYVVKKYRWQKYFKKIFLSSEIGVLKPDVKFFETVQAYLRLPKEQILMVDDSLSHGVYPARKFGWKALWIARNKKEKDRFKMENLREVLKYI